MQSLIALRFFGTGYKHGQTHHANVSPPPSATNGAAFGDNIGWAPAVCATDDHFGNTHVRLVRVSQWHTRQVFQATIGRPSHPLSDALPLPTRRACTKSSNNSILIICRSRLERFYVVIPTYDHGVDVNTPTSAKRHHATTSGALLGIFWHAILTKTFASSVNKGRLDFELSSIIVHSLIPFVYSSTSSYRLQGPPRLSRASVHPDVRFEKWLSSRPVTECVSCHKLSSRLIKRHIERGTPTLSKLLVLTPGALRAKKLHHPLAHKTQPNPMCPASRMPLCHTVPPSKP